MRYTRGVESKGDIWDRLEELQIDKVSAQKDIPAKQLGVEEISGDLRAQLRRELGGILEIWECDRTEESDQKKRPLLDSEELGVIDAGYDATRCEEHFGLTSTKLDNGEMAELEGLINRRTMELVGGFGSLPSATTGDG